MLKSPIVLMMLFSGLMMFAMPKLMVSLAIHSEDEQRGWRELLSEDLC